MPENMKEKQRIEQEKINRSLARVKNRIMIISGKGGVGKSTVSANLAMTLVQKGFQTGLLDIDVHGPSIPSFFNLSGQRLAVEDGRIIPAQYENKLKVMSTAFLLQNQDSAVIWRGPMKHGVIKQFISDVAWGDLDFLVIDSPPGTGDEPLSIAQLIQEPRFAVLVATPQNMAIIDVKKTVTFCQTLKIKILGVIENMSGFVCPYCNKVSYIFNKGGAEKMARDMQVPYLGAIPLDKDIVSASDQGKPYIIDHPDSAAAKQFSQVVERMLANLTQMSETA